MLEVRDLSVFRGDVQVLEDVGLTLEEGSVVVLLGPNGSGKTTLAQALLGREDLSVEGQISVDGEDITGLPTHERVKKGLFLLFQDPPRLDGIHLSSLVRRSEQAMGVDEDVNTFSRRFKDVLREVGIESLYARDVNSGSGGERKRSELAQALFLPVKYIIIDEVDSGMDVDGLKALAKHIRKMREDGKGILLITHNLDLLSYLSPDQVLVIKGGRIIERGSKEIVERIRERGFE